SRRSNASISLAPQEGGDFQLILIERVMHNGSSAVLVEPLRARSRRALGVLRYGLLARITWTSRRIATRDRGPLSRFGRRIRRFIAAAKPDRGEALQQRGAPLLRRGRCRRP